MQNVPAVGIIVKTLELMTNIRNYVVDVSRMLMVKVRLDVTPRMTFCDA